MVIQYVKGDATAPGGKSPNNLTGIGFNRK